MPPPHQELATQLTEGLNQTLSADRQEFIRSTIVGAADLETQAHRHAQVERAKLAAQVMQNPDVASVSMEVVDDAIAKVEEQTVLAQTQLKNTLPVIDRTSIEQQLALLENELQEYRMAKIDMMRTSNAQQEDASIITQVGDGLATVTDTTLPREWTSSMSRNKKIAVASLGVPLAAYAIMKLSQLLFAGAKKTGNAVRNSIGFFGKLMLGIGVVTGGYALMRKFNVLPDLIKKLEAMGLSAIDDVKNEGAKVLDGIKNGLGIDVDQRAAEKYGLTKEQYLDARKMYRKGNPLDAIKQEIFGLDPGDTSPEWETFAENMRREFAPERDESTGIEYTPSSSALESYEATAETICRQMVRWMDQHKTITILSTIGLARLGVLQRIFSGTGSALARLGNASRSMASMGLRNYKVVGLFALCGALATPKLVNAGTKNIRLPKNLDELLKASATEGAPIIKGQSLGADLSTLSDDIGRYGRMVGEVTGDVADWALVELRDLFDESIDILASDDAEIIASNHANTFSALRQQLLIDESSLRQSGNVELLRENLSAFEASKNALAAYQDLFLMHRTQDVPGEAPELRAALTTLKEALKPLGLVITYRKDRLVWYDEQDPENSLDFGVDPSERNHDTILQISQTLDAGEFMPDRLFSAAIQRFRMEQADNKERYPDKSSWLAMIVGNLLYVADPENLSQYYVVSVDAVKSLFDSDESWGDWAAKVGDASMQTALMTLGPTLGLRLIDKAIGVVPLYSIKAQGLRNFVPLIGQIDVFNEFRRMSGGVVNFAEFGILEGRKVNTILTQLRWEKSWFKTVMTTTKVNDLYRIAGEAGIDIDSYKKSRAILEDVRKVLRERMIAEINSVKKVSWTRRLNPLVRLRGGRFLRTVGSGENMFDLLSSAPSGFSTLSSLANKGARAIETTSKAFTTFLTQLNALRAGVGTTGAQLQAFILKNITLLRAAAPTNRSAAALLRVGSWLKIGGRGVLRAVPVLGVILDAVFIGANEMEIREAEAAGNMQKAETLRMKRMSLGGSGIGGLALLTANPLIAVPGAVAIGAGMYANAIYDDIVTWESSRDDWLQYPPEELERLIRERKLGYVDLGMRTGAGYTYAHGLWRWGRSWTSAGAEKNQIEDEQQYALIEGVNELVRQEMLSAYFLQTMRIPQMPDETPEEQKQRAEAMARDSLNYVRVMTSGTYAIGTFNMQRLTEGAQSYVDLMQIRRQRQSQGQDMRVAYDWDGTQKELDLTTLDYALGDGATGDSMPFLQTLHDYRSEFLLVQNALQEINSINISSLEQAA